MTTQTFSHNDSITPQTLRQFGLVLGAGLVLIFSILRPAISMALHGVEFEWIVWPWISLGVLTTLALIAPMILKPVYTLWMKFGHVMGAINSRIILAILFYGVILPVGLLMKVLGQDPLPKSFDVQAKTYREQSTQRAPEDMEKPY